MTRWFVFLFLMVSSTVYASEARDVTVNNLQHIETKRGAGYVFLSFKIDVENTGERGSVFVEILGKDANGFQISSVHANGMVNSSDRAVLTTTTAISEREFSNIVTWEISRIEKFIRP
ncbi:MAG: hypothetical protein VB050_03470 [Geobacteraceae bacterium]|nr:hypothetical protein [Geobacteraceae bacterium]